MLRCFLSEICHLPTRQTARFLSVLRVSSVGCPVAFCGVLQALLVSRRQQKTGAKAGFSTVLCSPWKRLGSQDGASGETRTLTLSPETDFESAASTDSATEAMAAQYREAPTVGQSGSWRGKHISGKLRGLSRVSPCVSPIFISTCPRP